MIFLDTSAIYALADRKDKNHKEAKRLFALALSRGQEFIIHNYIIVESTALIQRRLGFQQAKKFLKEVTRFYIIWIDFRLHRLADDYFSKQAGQRLSFVDCLSFVVMKEQGITHVLAFDDDFIKAGFLQLS